MALDLVCDFRDVAPLRHQALPSTGRCYWGGPVRRLGFCDRTGDDLPDRLDQLMRMRNMLLVPPGLDHRTGPDRRTVVRGLFRGVRSEEHTSELQSRQYL